MDEKIPSCDYCSAKFWKQLQQTHGEIPCFDCKYPELDRSNYLAWKVFATCSSQMRVVGMGTPMGIEFSAIDRAMDIVGIPEDERAETFEKVRRVGEAYAGMVRDDQEKERRQADLKSGNRATTRSAVMFPPMYKVK